MEFALVAPLLALLLTGSIDFGRVFFSWVQLTNAARVGANYAGLHVDAWGTPGNAGERAEYSTEINQEAAGINCQLPNPLPTPTFPAGTGLGADSRVELSCSFSLITPLMGNLLGNPLTIRANATFPIRAGCIGCPTPQPLPTPTLVPTASPTPTPGPTATPSPMPCNVPSFIGTNSGTAQSTWTVARFTTTISFRARGQLPYTIQYQSLVGGSLVPCDAGITLGPTP